MTLIRSKQIKTIKSFNKDDGMCILMTHKNGVMRMNVKQCEKELVDRVLEHHRTVENDSVESVETTKKWWQIWRKG